MLYETHFIKWRQQHDFPKLLKHFDSNLLLFKEWKSDQKLTDEIIIQYGLLTHGQIYFSLIRRGTEE